MHTLAEVDGTVPGVVLLVLARLDTEEPETMTQRFVERSDDIDPYTHAMGLLASIKDDWPNHTAQTICNPRAHYLITRKRMRDMGLDWTPAQFLAAKNT